MTSKARVEGGAASSRTRKTPDPIPGDNGAALLRIVAFFQAEHPEAWENLRLCPLQHAIEDMAARLKG